MPPERKFRELKTADEEKHTICHKVVFNIFAQWQNARLNKHAANEKKGSTWNGTKSKVLDTNLVNMTAESFCGRSLKGGWGTISALKC